MVKFILIDTQDGGIGTFNSIEEIRKALNWWEGDIEDSGPHKIIKIESSAPINIEELI